MEDYITIAIKTLSIPDWMNEFLKENPGLSPSKMLQSKIREIQEQKKIVYSKVRNLNHKITHMSGVLQKKCEECEDLQNELDLEKKKH